MVEIININAFSTIVGSIEIGDYISSIGGKSVSLYQKKQATLNNGVSSKKEN